MYLAIITKKLAIEAESNGANYVALGSIFNSKTKPNAPHCPLSIIENIKNDINIPIVGIGGITFEKSELCSTTLDVIQ